MEIACAGNIILPESITVSFEDIGGLERVKEEIQNLVGTSISSITFSVPSVFSLSSFLSLLLLFHLSPLPLVSLRTYFHLVLPFIKPELFSNPLLSVPKGILLYGPPGIFYYTSMDMLRTLIYMHLIRTLRIN